MEPLLPFTEVGSRPFVADLAWACGHPRNSRPGDAGGSRPLFRHRREALDTRLATSAWPIGPRRDGRGCVLADSPAPGARGRAGWAMPGHPAETRGPGIGHHGGRSRPGLFLLERLVRLTDWAVYAPANRRGPRSAVAEGDIRSACRRGPVHGRSPISPPCGDPVARGDTNRDDAAARHDGRMAQIDCIRTALNGAFAAKQRSTSSVLACLLAQGSPARSRTSPAWARRLWPRRWRQAVGGSFARVQCTPDLLPGDITGFRVFDRRRESSTFLPGPVFADVLLADEINRATPRTQSALLEAMAERQATIDNVRHVLSDTFFVIATQNPVEQHGTYPLPEAQLDRFAMKLRIGYPEKEHELAMLAAAVGLETLRGRPARVLGPRSAPLACRTAWRRCRWAMSVRDYLVRLRHASRDPSAGDAWPQPARFLDLAAPGAGRRFPRGRDYSSLPTTFKVALIRSWRSASASSRTRPGVLSRSSARCRSLFIARFSPREKGKNDDHRA